jgi:hypothetical protein
VYLQRCHGGHGGPGITGGKELHERSISPAATLDQIPATAGLGVEGGRLGKLPDGKSELLWVLAGAGVRRSSRSTVGPRALCVGVSGARVWGGCGVEDEVQGVHGSQIKAGPRISACGPGARARRRLRAAGARGGGKKEGRGRR